MRGTSADPATWRMWGGNDFDVAVANPYTTTVLDPHAHTCEPVLLFHTGPVKYIPSQNEYMALGGDQKSVVYAVSRDLIHWSTPAVLTSGIIGIYDSSIKAGTTTVPTAYPALFDPTSQSRSFETIETKPYMYYVEFPDVLKGGNANTDRHLMRVALTITY